MGNNRKNQYNKIPIRPSQDRGIYNKGDWLKESRLHLLAAKMLRECSAQKKPMISSLLNSGNQSSQRTDINILISQREAGNKSSILLIGYAFEMALKAGLVCLYVDMPRKILLRDIKKIYGHNLRLIANEIEVSLNVDELIKLDVLSKWIVDDARYPVTPKNDQSYIGQWNKLIHEFWNDDQFKEWLSLYEKIHSYVLKIDASTDDPKIPTKWIIHDDGYVIYRIGGNLKTRIIVRYSSQQKENGGDNKNSLKTLMLNNINHKVFKHYLTKDWDTAVYREIE